MNDDELIRIIKSLREFVAKERLLNSEREIDIFFINAIEIACSLTELGIVQNREIKDSEKYWFEGSYHMNFWESDIENKFYTPLVNEVAARNWFKANKKGFFKRK